MRIKRLSLENFRQFRDVDIEFSTDSNHNITVIHGQNGSGKTTILNAFLWVLYEKLQSIKRPDRLANQGAMKSADVGDTVTVSVELVCEHEGLHHEIRRRHVLQKQDGTDLAGMKVDDSFTVEYVTLEGNVREPSNPESYVRQIIPDDLAGLFFFDGEYISDLSGVDNQDEIQQAIRQMMGLTIMDRSINHLEWVEGQFRDDLHDSGTMELQTLISERDGIDAEKTTLQQKVEDKRAKKKRLQEEIDDINELLSSIGETRNLQEQRQALESDRKDFEAEREALNESLESLLSNRGFLTFAMPAIKDTAAELDNLREEGKIPSELDNQLVEKLLDQEECICGRPLPKQSDEADVVASYKSDVTADGLDQAAIRLIGQLGHIRDEHDDFFSEVTEIVSDRERISEKIETLNGKIDDISMQIQQQNQSVSGLDTSDISLDELDLDTVESTSDLEAARAGKDETVRELEKKIAVHETDIERMGEQIDDLEEQIDEAEAEQREAELARTRMQAAQAVRKELELYYEKFQQSIRKRANDRVDETFNQVATKNYQAIITEDFEMRIRDGEHGTPVEVDKSRGERQIASLSFIGSLVDIAREQYEADDDTEYFDGGIYPIVMDSPFGALDNEHRGEVSEVLPMLADQVIVMVTDSQWEGPVQKRMGPNVGAHYRLEYEENGGVDGSPVTEVYEQDRRDAEVARQ